MRRLSWLLFSLSFALCGVSDSWGAETDSSAFEKLRFSGFTNITSGKILSGRHQGQDLTNQAILQSFVNITANYTVNENLFMNFGITGRMWFETYPEIKRQPFNPRKQQYSFYPSDGSGTFHIDDWEPAKIVFQLGYFPFKYNSDSRNLGEYLFRTGTYPPFIITNIDLPFARILGARLSGAFFDKALQSQILLTQECEYPSFYDFTLTGLVDYKFSNIFSVGAGVMFNRFISVNDSVTAWRYSSENAYPDSSAGPPSYTSYYTFKGTKLMAKLSINPVRIFLQEENAGILGPDDLKIYTEFAALGLKNYPYYYEDVKKREPIMVGMNWPTFQPLAYSTVPAMIAARIEKNSKKQLSKALMWGAIGLTGGAGSWLADRFLKINSRLDVLAVEVEYYGWDFSNSLQKVVNDGFAIPQGPQGSYTLADYKKDNVKWSVYAKKTFNNHFNILAQIANDHLMLPAWDERNYDREEVLGKEKDMYWVLKIGFNF